MNRIVPLIALSALITSATFAQREQGPRPTDIGASPQAIGDAGVMWYTTWQTALDEAECSNRPIFFMSAAATCSGISGVF